MLKSNQPVSVKGVAALGAIVTLAALTGCVTRTREVVVERPTARSEEHTSELQSH